MLNFDEWKIVVFAGDCICEDGDEEDGLMTCPVCLIDYAECECPGPTMDDEYEYKEIDGVLYAKRKQNIEED